MACCSRKWSWCRTMQVVCTHLLDTLCGHSYRVTSAAGSQLDNDVVPRQPCPSSGGRRHGQLQVYPAHCHCSCNAASKQEQPRSACSAPEHMQTSMAPTARALLAIHTADVCNMGMGAPPYCVQQHKLTLKSQPILKINYLLKCVKF